MAYIGVEVKIEPAEMDNEQKILNLLNDNSKGLTDKEMFAFIPTIPTNTVLEILNRLLAQKRIDLLKKANGDLLFRLAATSSVSQAQGVDDDEKLVLQLIEEVGNKGIWRHDIKRKSHIIEMQLTKILNHLTTRKLIKQITSVSAGKKKMYILANLEPDPSVSGGNFYSGQQFDSEYFNMLNALCNRYLEDKANEAKSLPLNPVEQRERMLLSCQEVHACILNSKISKLFANIKLWESVLEMENLTKRNASKNTGDDKINVELTIKEIDEVLQTLVFDGKAEEVVRVNSSGVQTNYYRATTSLIGVTGLMHVPCGQCSLARECREGGVISPSTCVYIKDWLSF